MTLSLAIVFPAVLLMVVLVVQAALWWYASQAALTAAREGTDAGRIRGGTPQRAVQRASDFLDRQGSLAERVEVVPGGDAQMFSLRVSVRAQSLLPGMSGMTIVRQVTAPREKFVPQGGRP
ncbi:TadE/TadG family type IV pilus assembly protein [Saccharothrix sp. ST-888]|uniref:TadE/TadG family type IV pilus assembly protein n=1 Tax=Saccharothrix sp. ST-888 TaxID=1427391 RepID=UPI0006986641|nr:TadE/TadG family type IV pilus assembly protein [Saccharothrix sp. ST-888]